MYRRIVGVLLALTIAPSTALAEDVKLPPLQRQPTPQAVIDHIGYTVADFNRDRAKAALTAMGVKNVREAGRYSLHMDDPFGYDVQVSGLEAHALSDG